MAIQNQRIRCNDPQGNWDVKNLIGSKVKVKSMPISNFMQNEFKYAGKLLTVSEVYIRVSSEGKAITVIETEELPNKFFTLKDLQILSLNEHLQSDATCGDFCSSQSSAGHDVDPSSITGVAIIDDNVVFDDSYVKFTGAVDVEETYNEDKKSVVLNVNINGDVLD